LERNWALPVTDQKVTQQMFIRVLKKFYVSFNRDVAYGMWLDAEQARNAFTINNMYA
jgi:hypothetical protein